MNTEIWKDIPGYEGYYQASTYGRIRNMKGKILSQQLHHQGYLKISLCVIYKKKTIKTHRLIALTFIDNPLNKKCVCHKDNNKSNNFIDNLYWGTHSQNMLQAVNDGILMGSFHSSNPHSLKQGSLSWFAKKVVQLSTNETHLMDFGSMIDAEVYTGVARQSISAVCRGKRKTAGGFKWKYII